ncbi:MAG TPA: hypothetical protein VFR99_02775 [Marmoricola sp.]|nr:hypothetical protein [Marmoricola sp.]
MADPDLTSLARAWADRTREPDFDALVGRAHDRRRRRVLALVAAAAAVLVVAGLSAVLLQRGPSAAPLPTDRRSHQPADRESAVWIVAHGRLVSYAAGLGGWTSNGGPPDAPDRVLAVWQHCRADDTGCRSAWRLTDWHGQQIATGRARSSADGGSGVNAVAWGDVFVLRSWNRPGIVVSPDGTSAPLRDVDSGTVRPGDLLLRAGRGFAVADPRTATAWPLQAPGAVGVATATIAADGTPWVMPAPGRDRASGKVTVRWSRQGTWHEHLLSRGTRDTGGPAMPGLLTTAGHHVVAMSSFDGATVLPVGTFAVSADDGRHWTDLTREQLPFDFVDSMAATSGGTLYVVGDPDGRGRWRLFRSTDASWTHFEQVPGARDVDQLTPGGPVVLGRTGSLEEPGLVAYDDHGNRTDVPIR